MVGNEAQYGLGLLVVVFVSVTSLRKEIYQRNEPAQEVRMIFKSSEVIVWMY